MKAHFEDENMFSEKWKVITTTAFLAPLCDLINENSGNLPTTWENQP